MFTSQHSNDMTLSEQRAHGEQPQGGDDFNLTSGKEDGVTKQIDVPSSPAQEFSSLVQPRSFESLTDLVTPLSFVCPHVIVLFANTNRTVLAPGVKLEENGPLQNNKSDVVFKTANVIRPLQ